MILRRATLLAAAGTSIRLFQIGDVVEGIDLAQVQLLKKYMWHDIERARELPNANQRRSMLDQDVVFIHCANTSGFPS